MPRARNIETVILLGAGASAADGAPIQSALLREYFAYCRSGEHLAPRNGPDGDLSGFFRQFFGLDVATGDLAGVEFPTFEEVLGVLELADSERESFRSLTGIEEDDQAASLRRVHDDLVFSIAEVLHHKLQRASPIHLRLIESLSTHGSLQRIAFVSLNYDIIIDNALHQSGRPDYGFELVGESHPSAQSPCLLKVHGSLNWLFCPTCRDIQLTPMEKGVLRIRLEPETARCHACRTLRKPIVIPPTFFKVLSNLQLRTVWNVAEQAFVKAAKWIFCGYSFPDADIHLRYMLKRAEQRRDEPPQVFIANHHEGKEASAGSLEKARYRRFFADKEKVHFTDVSFQEFAENPGLVEDRTRWLS